MRYEDFSPIVNKLLNPDGSVTTSSGEIIRAASPQGMEEYRRRVPMVAKFLHPNGEITNTIPVTGGDSSVGGGLYDAPADDTLYGRKNNVWHRIPEALSNNLLYLRSGRPATNNILMTTEGFDGVSTLLPNTWFGSNPSSWTDLQTGEADPAVGDLVLEFVEGSPFWAKLWANSDLARDSTQFRITVWDATLGAVIGTATGTVNLPNNTQSPIPIILKGVITATIRDTLNNIQLTIAANSPQWGLQMALLSSFPNMLSFIAFNSQAQD